MTQQDSTQCDLTMDVTHWRQLHSQIYHIFRSVYIANIYCKLSTYLNYQIKTLFMMWGGGGVPPPMDKGVGFIHTRSVHARTMSLTEDVFDASLPNSNSAAALCPHCPSTPSIHTVHPHCPPPHKYFNMCEVDTYPCPLSLSTNSHPSTCTHLINDNPPLPSTVQHIMQASQG